VAQQVAKPQTGETTGGHNSTGGHDPTGATNADTTPSTDGEADTGTEKIVHSSTDNGRQDATLTTHAETKGNRTGNTTCSHAKRPPTPEPAADAELQGEKNVPATLPGKTGTTRKHSP